MLFHAWKIRYLMIKLSLSAWLDSLLSMSAFAQHSDIGPQMFRALTSLTFVSYLHLKVIHRMELAMRCVRDHRSRAMIQRMLASWMRLFWGYSLPIFINAPECKIDPGWRYFFCRGETVFPMGLSWTLHDQKAAMFQHQRHGFPGSFMLEGKLPFCTQAQRGDGTIFFQIFFSITVPCHAFTAIMIQIQ